MLQFQKDFDDDSAKVIPTGTTKTTKGKTATTKLEQLQVGKASPSTKDAKSKDTKAGKDGKPESDEKEKETSEVKTPLAKKATVKNGGRRAVCFDLVICCLILFIVLAFLRCALILFAVYNPSSVRLVLFTIKLHYTIPFVQNRRNQRMGFTAACFKGS